MDDYFLLDDESFLSLFSPLFFSESCLASGCLVESDLLSDLSVLASDFSSDFPSDFSVLASVFASVFSSDFSEDAAGVLAADLSFSFGASEAFLSSAAPSPPSAGAGALAGADSFFAAGVSAGVAVAG